VLFSWSVTIPSSVKQACHLPHQGEGSRPGANLPDKPQFENICERSAVPLKTIYSHIVRLVEEIRSFHLGAFAAQSAFFLIMSFVPLTLLTLSIMSFFDIDVTWLTGLVGNLAFQPSTVGERLFSDITLHTNTLLSFNTVFTAWSAGKAFYAISEGFHFALGIRDERNYFVLRIKGLAYSFVFALLVSSIVITGVFGRELLEIIGKIFSFDLKADAIANSLRGLYVFFSILLIMILLYRYIPDWDTALRCRKISSKPKITHILGICVIMAVVIYVFTIGFSVYITKFSSVSITYGSLAALVGIMLWLYFVMYVFLAGFRLLIKN